MIKILITGGAGYLGNILVNKLFAARGQAMALSHYDHMVIDNLKPNHEFYQDYSHILREEVEITVYDNLMYRQICLTDHCYRKDFNFVKADVRDKETLAKWVDWADIIIPLAAIVGMPACERDPDLAYQVNYEQILTIVKNLRPNQKIIYPNTNSGYGLGKGEEFCTEESPLKPISVYGKTKCEAEDLIRDTNNWIVLRLATVFGISPRMRLDLLVNDFVYKAQNDGYLVLFEKDFKRNYIHIQDIALTFIYLINRFEDMKNQVYNVGLSSANLTKIELAEKIKEYLPSLVIKWDNYKTDPDKRDYIVSNKKLESFGWSPYYQLDHGIQELIKAYEIINYNKNRDFTNL